MIARELVEDVREILEPLDEEGLVLLVSQLNLDLFECRRYNSLLIERFVKVKNENRELRAARFEKRLASAEWQLGDGSSLDRTPKSGSVRFRLRGALRSASRRWGSDNRAELSSGSVGVEG